MEMLMDSNKEKRVDKCLSECRKKKTFLIIFGCAFLVFLILFGILLYYWKKHIIYIYEMTLTQLYHHRFCQRLFSQNYETHFNKHASIFYHDEDSKQLKMILNNSNSAYRIGFKEQDYNAGVPVQQESVRLMTNSKCIIILLSRRYFDSYECREEFRSAQNFSER